jgi:hypothetical protein
MPDEHGKLLPDDFVKARRWFDVHWKEPVVCPVCKNSNWRHIEHVVVLARHASDSLIGDSVAYPMIPVYCTTCSHTILFSSVMMGISSAHTEEAAHPLKIEGPG